MTTRNLLFVIISTLLISTTYAQDIYVNVDGDDSNAGTEENPVASLEAARDLIRQYKAVKILPKGGITVWIGKGQYDQQKSFVLNENDSGEPDAPIVWRALPDEKVSITGGQSIPSEKFKKVTDKAIIRRLSGNAIGKVMQVDFKAL
jgi:hypothetical protein